MSDQSKSHRYSVGQIDDGSWLAVSSKAPYFCFAGETADEVSATVERALVFYFGVNGKARIVDHTKKPVRTKDLGTFIRKRVVNNKDVEPVR